jgi:hypothetical protein
MTEWPFHYDFKESGKAVELNRLMGSQPFLLDNWISNGNAYI